MEKIVTIPGEELFTKSRPENDPKFTSRDNMSVSSFILEFYPTQDEFFFSLCKNNICCKKKIS